jgi:hypothetical protein
MEIEYILYLQDSLKNPSFLNELDKLGMFYQYFKSSKHHPRAIIVYRTHYSKKIISSDYSKNCSKLVLIYLNQISTKEELDNLNRYLIMYNHNKIKVLLIIQSTNDLLESSKFVDQDLTRDYYEDWLCKCMFKGADCIETDSYKETADVILKVLTILTHSPYKQEATIYKTKSKTLSENTEIPQSHKDWALQLINIPGISENKASLIISKFPTLRSLFEFYQNPSIKMSDKLNVLQDISERKQKKLSKKIFTVYNSINPNEIV